MTSHKLQTPPSAVCTNQKLVIGLIGYRKISQYTCVVFKYSFCVKCQYLCDLMHAVQKIRKLVIWD